MADAASRETPPPGRDELLARLARVREAILGVCEALPAARRDERFLGEWSARDLLAHLIGWDRVDIEAIDDLVAGRLPAFYAEHDADWATINARLVRRYRMDDWTALLTAARASQQALSARLRELPEADFGRDHGVRWQGRRVTLRGLLAAARRDEEEHLQQLLAFQQAAAHDGGTSARIRS